ncbi:MAG: GTPase HflX [Oscillospiraceae bacterium]|nr:GTPase HflX [Oscillospiraceae bacterium]
MNTRTMLCAVDFGRYNMEDSIKELTALCEAAELEVIFSLVQNRDNPEKKYYLGEGKLEEAKDLAEKNEIELCVFDAELTGSQIRNISDFLGIEVIDRTMLILEIFSRRATTAEGKLQTELALLKYRLPRLSGVGASMSRQGGGGAGGGGARRGAGETKLELDRRYINQRIDFIKDKLAQVEKRRDLLNTARKKNEVPIVALAGYTNVGKSSLLNALTGSDIFEKDMLFATLDPTARKLVLPSGQTVILVDTVGFVSRLPHNMVEAFKSTLEQAKYADIILRVCDIASEDRDLQLQVTGSVLAEIGCDTENIITVYNKADKDHGEYAPRDGIITSAKSGLGLDDLLLKIDEMLSRRMCDLDIVLPYSKTALLNTIRENGRVDSENYTEAGIEITGKVNRRYMYMFTEFSKI